MATSKTKTTTCNNEMYIQESLACVDYLLKNTDDVNCCNASDIVTYIERKYKYTARRQRITKILQILESHDKETRRLGFVVSSKQTGKDPSRRKFYISERLLTNSEITAIEICLRNSSTKLLEDDRIKDIVDGLRIIFPTDQDKYINKVNAQTLIKTDAKVNDKKESINQAFVKKYPVAIKTKSLHTICGRIKQIYYQGNGDYEIEVFDEDGITKVIKLSDIIDVVIRYTKVINLEVPTQLEGNLNLNASLMGFKTTKSMSYLTLDKVYKQFEKPMKNNQLTYIGFDFGDVKIIESFNKEFNINLFKCLHAEEKRNNHYSEDEIGSLRTTRAYVRVPRKQFIIWASRLENVLDLYNITPKDVDMEIQNRVEEYARLVKQKYAFINNFIYEDFEVGIRQNNEITITKILSNKETITIPDFIIGFKVTSIDKNACYNNENIKKLILGQNIKVIGESAFVRCINLKEVVFNAKLEIVSKSAFFQCEALENIRIDGNISCIGNSAFAQCTSLIKASIFSYEPTYLFIDDRAFEYCININTVDIAFVDYLGERLFDFCDKLKRLYLRCSPNLDVRDNFLTNPNVIVSVQFNDHDPDIDPFKNTICKDKYEYEEPTHWYDEE